MKRTKIFAAYLPQYHITKDNNRFWGEGFTDWVGVKNAKPLFDGHFQPRIPLNNNYYDLSNPDVIRWQASLAKKYGIDGFNIYHYWFKDGYKTLNIPSELLLLYKDINIKFFFSWDNNSWIRSWSNIAGNSWSPKYDGIENNMENSVLLELDYGDRNQWRNHFEYLRPFFEDSRYLKIDNRPVFVFMRAYLPKVLNEMKLEWEEMAKSIGFDGVFLISQNKVFDSKRVLDSQFLYEPRYSVVGKKEAIEDRIKKRLGISIHNSKSPVRFLYNYEDAWIKIIKSANRWKDKEMFLSGIVGFDDSPRRGKDARVIYGQSPEIYERYLEILYRICCENDKELMFLTAWNEWGEGAYLEPDEQYGTAYLEASKRAIERVREESALTDED